MVKIANLQTSGIFTSTQSLKISGAVNNDSEQIYDDNNNLLLWAQPNQSINISILIDPVDLANVELGKISFTISPLDFNENNLTNFGKTLFEYPDSSEVDFWKQSSSSINLLKDMASILRHKQLFEEFVDSLPTSKIKFLTEKFGRLAKSDITNKYYGPYAKDAAAVITYKLALGMLNAMKPYCEKVTIDLPLTGNKTQVLGLRAAGFWLFRATNRIESYNFDDYDAILSEMNGLMTKKMTYKGAMNDKNTQANLERAYDLLSNTSDMTKTPFGAAAHDLDLVLVNFKSIGTDSDAPISLKNKLHDLSLLEDKFYSDLISEYEKYDNQDESLINPQDIISELSILKIEKDEVVKTFKNKIRIVSLADNPTSDSAFADMTKALTNYISLFDQDIGTPYFDQIRKIILTTQGNSELVQSSKKCIITGE